MDKNIKKECNKSHPKIEFTEIDSKELAKKIIELTKKTLLKVNHHQL